MDECRFTLSPLPHEASSTTKDRAQYDQSEQDGEDRVGFVERHEVFPEPCLDDVDEGYQCLFQSCL